MIGGHFMTDLWGNLNLDSKEEEFQDPLVILKEQAAMLNSKTSYQLKVKVDIKQINFQMHEFRMTGEFNITCPNLDGYTYNLLTLYFTPSISFPVLIEWQQQEYRIDNIFDFNNQLKYIFSNEETQKIILTLYSKNAKG